LSPETLEWHRSLEEKVDRDDRAQGSWKSKIFHNFILARTDDGQERADFCNSAFKHLEDLGKTTNKRIYIGPGRDGSSDDEISIDLKFGPTSTKVTYNRMWKERGYVKTTLVPVEDRKTANKWAVAELQAPLEDTVELGTIYEKLYAKGVDGKITRLVAIIHPNVPYPGVDNAPDPTAYTAVDAALDYEDEISCFYCGEQESSKHCDTCGKNMCEACTEDIGGLCACMIADNTEVALNNFTPNPTDGKSTTFKKAQRKAVKQGVEQVRQQDEAMWSALTGKTSTSMPRKCLLAVTLCHSMFQNAIGQSTTFF
jgi:hypothetical protein